MLLKGRGAIVLTVCGRSESAGDRAGGLVDSGSRGPVTRGVVAQAAAGLAAGWVAVWRHSLSRLWVPHSSFHSALQARMPRRRNRRAPCCSLIWPSKTGRTGKPRKDGKPSASQSEGLRAAMFAKLSSDDGKACYARRKVTVEPVFGQLKEQQGARRFLRRGLAACEAEWKLLCGTHNLLKLWRHTRRQAAATAITT